MTLAPVSRSAIVPSSFRIGICVSSISPDEPEAGYALRELRMRSATARVGGRVRSGECRLISVSCGEPDEAAQQGTRPRGRIPSLWRAPAYVNRLQVTP